MGFARRTWAPWRRTSSYGLARTYGVTPHWVRELRRRFLPGLELSCLGHVGRPRKTITEDERAFILRAEEERLNLVVLEMAIEGYRGVHLRHNRLLRVLKEEGRVADSPARQRRA